MGYEVKMYIVEPSIITTSYFFSTFEDKVVEVFCDEDANHYHFGLDGNTKTQIDPYSDIILKNYCQVIGMVNLCKINMGGFDKKKAEYFFYDTDGDTPIVLDRWDEELTQAPLEIVIEWLENEIAKGSKYRRFKTALALAKGCVGLYDND
jgi:hypothetical protein